VTARTRTTAAWTICALLLVPRLIRLAHPQVWIEDESYLTGALMLSHGWLPYRDFPLPHYPLLEALLASVFRLSHPSLRTAEISTQIAAFAGSLLVFALGRRLDGLLTGTVAAFVFATSGLLFRYHLFEREVFLVVPVLAAVLLASARSSAKDLLDRNASSSRRSSQTRRKVRLKPDTTYDLKPVTTYRAASGIGALLFVALAIKLTAVAALLAVALQLWFRAADESVGHAGPPLRGARVGWRPVAWTVGTAIALLAALTIALAVVFGRDFLVQVFLFRAIHAAFPSLAVKLTEMRLTMDVSLALGAAGVALLLWTRRAAVWAGPLLQLACGFVLLVLFNPTYWAHTGIELLPWLSLCAGWLVASIVRAVRRQPGARVSPVKAYACAIAAAALLIFFAPVRNLNWEAGDGSTYGFGYRDRRDIDAVAAYIDAHTDAQALIAAPPIIAFAADRRELVPYPEIAGTIDELTDAVRRRGYLAALRDPDLRHGSFWDSVEASRERIAPQIAGALTDRRLAALVNDSPDDLMPIQFVDVPQAALEADGYQLESAFAHYDVWLPGKTTRQD
jgi:hypothetical protein